jgi:hypothetical protein
MTTNSTAKQELATVTTYMIPKRWVWSAIALLLGWLVYAAYDRVVHMNWPPADMSNQKQIKSMSLNCSKKNKGRPGFVTQEALNGKLERSNYIPLGFDRMDFIDEPECMGVRLYLIYEGSGVREEFNVYDMTTKIKTAHIVITHETFAHE